MIDVVVAERMFVALKHLSDLAQESCLAFQDEVQNEARRKEYRNLVGDLIGRAYDPLLMALMRQFPELTMGRLRERIPLPAPMTAGALMSVLVKQGNSIITEFAGEIHSGEREGFFRKGGFDDLAAEIQRFELFTTTKKENISQIR